MRPYFQPFRSNFWGSVNVNVWELRGKCAWVVCREYVKATAVPKHIETRRSELESEGYQVALPSTACCSAHSIWCGSFPAAAILSGPCPCLHISVLT